MRMIEEPRSILASFRQSLLALRFKNKISYKELSRRTGISTRSLRGIESGSIEQIDFLTVTKLAASLSCNAWDMVSTGQLSDGITATKSLYFPESAHVRNSNNFEKIRLDLLMKAAKRKRAVESLRQKRELLKQDREFFLSELRKKSLIGF